MAIAYNRHTRAPEFALSPARSASRGPHPPEPVSRYLRRVSLRKLVRRYAAAFTLPVPVPAISRVICARLSPVIFPRYRRTSPLPLRFSSSYLLPQRLLHPTVYLLPALARKPDLIASLQKRLDLFQVQLLRLFHADDQPPACRISPPGSSCMRNHSRSRLILYETRLIIYMTEITCYADEASAKLVPACLPTENSNRLDSLWICSAYTR